MYENSFRMPREFDTTLTCDRCGKPLRLLRGCQSVHLECTACRARFELSQYASRIDDDLEEILARLNVDRI